MGNFIKKLIRYNYSIFFQRFIFFISVLLTTYIARGQNEEAKNQLEKNKFQINHTDEWFYYPFTIQIDPQLTFVSDNAYLDALKKHAKITNLKRSISLGISWLHINRKTWKIFNCYPEIGFAFNYYHFGKLVKSKKLVIQGKGLGAMVYVVPYYNHLKRHTLTPKLGIGFVNLDIPLDRKNVKEDDETNIDKKSFLESEVYKGNNLHLLFGLLYKFKLTPKFHLYASLNYNYIPVSKKISTKQHNNNFNFLSVNVGAGYMPNPSNVTYGHKQKNKSRVDLGTLFSVKKLPSDTSKQHTVKGIYAQYSGQIGGNSALTFATEWIQDGTIIEKLHNMVNKSAMTISFLGGHEFLWGPLVFGQQIGAYVWNIDKDVFKIPVYLRFGINYRVTKTIFIGINMKTTRIKEHDFVDVRIGYSLN